MNTTILAAVLGGLLSGFSLIVAIGAQNAFVLRQGVSRQHIGVVVAICAISDLVLIIAGRRRRGCARRRGTPRSFAS